MDPLNNLSDAQSKAQNFALNFISSLGSGGATDSLFANLLSQTETPAPPASDPQVNAQNSAAADQQQSQQNTIPDNPATTDAAATSSANTPPAADSKAAGKPARHEIKSTANKEHARHIAGSKSKHAAPTATGAGQAAAGKNAPAAAAAGKAASNGTDANSPTDITAPAADAADPTEAAGIPAITGTDDPSAPAAASSGDPDATAAPAKPDADTTISDLMKLLMQLEHLTAQQLAAATPPTNAGPAAATGGTDPDAGAAAAAALAASTQDKLDLKALLAALAGSGNANPAAADGNGQGDVAPAGDGQDTAAAATAATLQNTLSKTGPAAPADAGKSDWMNADFFNLFNTPVNNPANPVPFIPGTAAAAQLLAGGGNDAALDTNVQDQSTGQGAAGSRNGADALADNNLTPLANTPPPSNPYDFASQLSALRAAKGGAAGLPTPVDQVMLQLSRGISKDGSSQMTIQLRPAELGRIDVKLNVASDGKVQGTVVADNAATLALLHKDVGSLERALQEAGLRADPGSLQFSLRGDGQPGGSFGQSGGNPSGAGNNANVPSNSIAAIAAPSETYYLTPGGVNMHV